VPETMPMSQLLRHFQKTHQLMAMVVDEHGTIVGVVTLENVMEQIVGSVEDEFDTEPPYFTPDGDSRYIVLGSTPLEMVNEHLGLFLEAEDVDTIAGALLEQVGRLLQKGDCIELPGARAEVIEVEGARAKRIRVTLDHPQAEEQTTDDGTSQSNSR
jgi:CBS domain containing-hemolysin-like protein